MYLCVVGGGRGGGGGGLKKFLPFFLGAGIGFGLAIINCLGPATLESNLSIHPFSPAGVTASHQLLYQFYPRKLKKKMLPVRPKSLSAGTQQNRLVVAVSNAVLLSLASSIEDTCIHPSYAIAPFEKPAKIFNH